MDKTERDALRGRWLPQPTISRLFDYCDELERKLEAGESLEAPAPAAPLETPQEIVALVPGRKERLVEELLAILQRENQNEDTAPERIVAWIRATYPTWKVALRVATAIEQGAWRR